MNYWGQKENGGSCWQRKMILSCERPRSLRRPTHVEHIVCTTTQTSTSCSVTLASPFEQLVWAVETSCSLRQEQEQPLSWFHRRRAALRPRAPCRTGRWRSASARGRCNPRGRCAGRAGTEWNPQTQNPACRSHTCGREETPVTHSLQTFSGFPVHFLSCRFFFL